MRKTAGIKQHGWIVFALAALLEATGLAAPPLPGAPAIGPSSDPALPSEFNTFLPPGGGEVKPDAPVIAAHNISAGPDDSIVVTGRGLAGDRFLVYGQTTANDAMFSDARVGDATAYGDILTIGASEPANSMYLIWPISPAGVVGTPISINHTQAKWLLPSIAAAGETVRVYGRNLSNKSASPRSWVYLQAASGAGQWATVTAVNPYKVDFSIPASLAQGTYEVWVNNGLGGRYGWSSPLTLTIGPAELWDGPTVNVRDFGATASGATDDTVAVERAIGALKPGGTLYFPAGRYRIASDQISLPSDVRVMGDGAEQSTLVFTGDLNAFNKQTGRGPYAIGAPDDWRIHHVEFDALAMEYLGPSVAGSLVREQSGHDLKFNNVRLVAKRLNVIDWEGASDVSLTHCIVAGVEVVALDASDVQIDHTDFYLAGKTEAAISVWAGHNVSVTHCTVQNYQSSSNDPDGWGQGRLMTYNLFWGSIDDQYVADNTTIDMGYPTRDNAGEQICIEGAQDVYFGPPLWVTASTIVIPLVQAPRNIYENLNVIVTVGSGIGQMRTVRSVLPWNGRLTLILDRAWAVVPNAASRVEVCTTLHDCVYYHNTFSCQTGRNGIDHLISAMGMELYQGGYNVVFDGNTTNHLLIGVNLCSNYTCNPCYFVDINNNQFNDSEEGIAFQPQPGKGPMAPDNDPNFIGVIVRHNRVDHALQGIALVRPRFSGTATLSVVEHNTVENAPVGIAVYDDPNVLIRDNDFDAGREAGPGSTGVWYGDSSHAARFSNNVFAHFAKERSD